MIADTRAVIAFSAEDFARRARAAGERGGYSAAPWASLSEGDHRLNPDLADVILREGLRAAAVLVLAVERGADSALLFTQRTARLRAHSGQISFPGGSVDAEDGSPDAAALREAREEIGLDLSRVEVVGRLPDYATGSGYRITPVLAVASPPLDLTPNADEVDAVFEVPLRVLMDPATHERGSRVWDGRERAFYVMPHEGRRVWGITAGLVRLVYERLYA